MAQLRDPSVPVVDLAAPGDLAFAEDCGTAGGAGCTDTGSTKQTCRIEVTRGMDVRLRLTRLPNRSEVQSGG